MNRYSASVNERRKNAAPRYSHNAMPNVLNVVGSRAMLRAPAHAVTLSIRRCASAPRHARSEDVETARSPCRRARRVIFAVAATFDVLLIERYVIVARAARAATIN